MSFNLLFFVARYHGDLDANGEVISDTSDNGVDDEEITDNGKILTTLAVSSSTNMPQAEGYMPRFDKKEALNRFWLRPSGNMVRCINFFH